MKLKFHQIVDPKGNTNKFCGASAISAVTGMASGSASKLIRQVGGRKTIKGAYTSEIVDSLYKCNINAVTQDPRVLGVKMPDGSDRRAWTQKPRVSLAKWLKHSKTIRTSGRIYLIVAGNHFQLVSGRKYTCGKVRDIVSIKSKSVSRRAQVERVYELVAKEGGVRIPEWLTEKKKLSSQQQLNNKHRYQAKKLMKEFGIEAEVEYRCSETKEYQYFVKMPDEYEELAHHLQDDLHHYHLAWGWYEIYGIVERQVEFIKENKDHSWLKEYRQRK